MSNSPPHMGGIAEDLFSEWNGGTESNNGRQKQNLENENVIFDETNDYTPPTKEGDNNDSTPIVKESEKCNTSPAVENSNLLPPVQPGSSGEGFPYAPMNWPNPGDTWGWRVGRRYNNVGIFGDRFLYVPASLRVKNSPKVFASKLAIEKYIRTYFPDADVEAFFSSFSWKIPAIMETPAKADAPPAPQEPLTGVGAEETGTGRKVSLRKRKEIKPETPPAPLPVSVIKPKKKQKKTETPRATQETPHTSKGKERPKNTSNRQTRQTLLHAVPSAPKDTNGTAELSLPEVPTEEFDNYLNSLDDILAQPLSEGPVSHPASNTFSVEEDEMAEARIRLSLLLDMDFASLIQSQDLNELASLAEKLQKDPSLNAEQLVKLKLIEEIPSFSKVFLENKELMEQANKFFDSLEANKGKVASLRKEYSELKERVTQVQTEMDSNSSAIQEIDAQIAELKSRRNQLTKVIENKKKDKVELTHNQRVVANSIPKVVNEIQAANAKRSDWERKKDNAVKREAEILSKFAPLRGFSFRIGNFLDFSEAPQQFASNGAGTGNFSSHGNGNFTSQGHGDGGTYIHLNNSMHSPVKNEATGREGYPSVSHSRSHLSWL